MFPEDNTLKGVSDDELFTKVSQFVHSEQFKTGVSGVALPQYTRVSAAAVSTDCGEDIALVVFDAIALALAFVGLYFHFSSSEEEALVKGIAATVDESLPMWRQLIQAVKDADTMTDKAKAIFAIVKAAWTAGMFKGILRQIEDTMKWWDWAITGVAAVAQLAALILTDGASFIAELVVDTAAVAQLVSDAVKAVQTCG